MKLIMNYKGYMIKQVTDMDIKKGNIVDYKLGEFYVFTRDNEIEYDGCETLDEAKQQIDGLKMDKMETKGKRLIRKNDFKTEELLRKNETYDFEKFLNWKDDGDELADPSMNDYLKGYQIDAYDFKQWASNKKDFIKESAKETDNMQMLPWYLADKILTLWNGADGPLQNFFEGFTLRYPNNLKKELANFLQMAGYKVYPVLTMDKPIYAGNLNKFKDIQLSDESLKQTEDYLSGNRDPIDKGTCNTVDNLRNEPGIPPNEYETRNDGNGWYRGSRLLKKK